MTYKHFLVSLVLVVFVGCVAPLKEIKDANKSFERSMYCFRQIK